METPSLVLGTAGHIDHGKSALVKALTGTDPDRLPEEKARGVTIELGFARLTLPSGRVMGVVDVPGHERFVRQMVAGATGIDVVLLVVAADDGVMPQTREHVAVIDLLGIDRGVVAITKADLADDDWISLVAEDVRELLAPTSIAAAPIVAVSARTGRGLPELLEALDLVAGETPSRQAALPARLPVDRVFTIAGAGTVVTGTLWSGTVAPNDQVEVLPGGKRARVRSVQVHSEPVEAATAGQRVAVNLVGLEKADLSRGDILAAPDTLSVTDRFDARFTFLGVPGDDRPFESGTRVHVHHGTREVLGRVLLMDAEELAPGGSSLAQVRLEEPVAPRYGDRFIARSYSPTYTIGGGLVLDVLPPRRTRLRPHERELLEALVAGDLSAATSGLVASRGLPMTAPQVAAALGLPPADVLAELERSPLERLAAGGTTYYADPDALESLAEGVAAALLAFHEAEPKATGIPLATLRDRVDSRLSSKVFDALVDLAVRRGEAIVEGGSARHPRAAVSALAEERAAMDRIIALLEEQALQPGTLSELASEASVDTTVARKALAKLVAEGRAVRIASDLHFGTPAIAEAVRRVEARLGGGEGATAAELRDALGVSRKYAIPLLEHLDGTGVTRREGDLRTLRR